MPAAEQPQRPDVTGQAAMGDHEAGNAALSPLEGGRWRPVRPDELLRKPVPENEDGDSAAEPKVRLERRQHLEQHVRSSPTDLDAFLELAGIYRREDRPLEARRVLEQARQIFPDDQTVLWELEEATLARSLQQYREVSDLASRLQTSEADHELQRSQSDWARRRIEVCRARLARDPSMVHLRISLAEALLDAGLHGEVFAELQPIQDHHELAPQANLLLGRCHLALGNDVEAMPLLRAASLRRAVVGPPRIRVAALRLLCDTAERLGVTLTLERYRQQLRQAEQEANLPTPSES